MKIRSAVLLLFVQTICLLAQTLNSITDLTDNKKNSIDLVVQKSAQKFMGDKRTVGLSIGILKDGRTYSYNYGEVEKGKKGLPSQQTIYEIASITKTFSGVLLAQAVTEKRVKMDDDVRKYLDGNYPNLEFEGHAIKLFHLINHTSRLPFLLPDRPDLFQNPDPIELPKILTQISRNYTKTKFYEDLHSVKLDKIPGVDFKYSNAAAQLLGYILERVYQTSYEQLVAEKITNHLGMKDTKITLSSAEKSRLATGYYENGTVALYSPPQSQAAGALHSSVSDMLKYLKFHLSEDNEVIKLSHQPTWGDINIHASGLNWQMNKTSAGHRRVWQSGGSFGFSSYCVVFPELNFGIVLLSNEADGNTQARLNTMADEILSGIGEN